jgi:predicted DNA-binding protein
MEPHDHSTDNGLLLQGGGVLSPELLAAIQREAKASRRSPERMVREWLEDAADYREAVAVMKRVRDGKEQVHDAEDVYKRLGLK